jgi:hypothetical protein
MFSMVKIGSVASSAIHKSIRHHALSSLIYASIILPIMTKSSLEIKNNISLGLPALAVSYYQRIFNSNNSYILGDFYIDTDNFFLRTVDFYNLGELIQRLGFKLLGSNILLTYYLYSLIYLSLWIFLITRIVNFGLSRNITKSFFITSIILVLFFSRYSFFKGLYPFAQIINPQFSIVIWLYGIFLLFKILDEGETKKRNLWFVVLYAMNITVASLSYLFVFISLISTSLVAILYMLSKKQYHKSFFLTLVIFISVVPYTLITLRNINDKNSLELVERLGLISSRLPGAALTLLIIFITLISIFSNRKLFAETKSFLFRKVLTITTIGLIIASQSNIVTNRSIQFSDHFLVFAVCNLVILMIFFTLHLKILDIKLLTPKLILVPLMISLVVYSVFKTFLPAIQFEKEHNLYKLISYKFDSYTNVIVDAPIADAFPIYSNSKILYQNDIYTYKFSNRELLERYYISKGCPRNLDLQKTSPIGVYRFEAYMQKSQSIEKYLSFFNLEKKLSYLFLQLRSKAVNIESDIQTEIRNFLIGSEGKNCITLARSFGVDFIVFDESSLWNDNPNLFKTKFNLLDKYKYVDIR